jgi:hypothetical protein
LVSSAEIPRLSERDGSVSIEVMLDLLTIWWDSFAVLGKLDKVGG